MKYTAPVAEKLAIESINVLLTSGDTCTRVHCPRDMSLPDMPCQID